MLNVEFKVNGQLIGFMNIHNDDFVSNHTCQYSYTLVDDEGKSSFDGILHSRKDGYKSLVIECLKHAMETK